MSSVLIDSPILDLSKAQELNKPKDNQQNSDRQGSFSDSYEQIQKQIERNRARDSHAERVAQRKQGHREATQNQTEHTRENTVADKSQSVAHSVAEKGTAVKQDELDRRDPPKIANDTKVNDNSHNRKIADQDANSQQGGAQASGQSAVTDDGLTQEDSVFGAVNSEGTALTRHNESKLGLSQMGYLYSVIEDTGLANSHLENMNRIEGQVNLVNPNAALQGKDSIVTDSVSQINFTSYKAKDGILLNDASTFPASIGLLGNKHESLGGQAISLDRTSFLAATQTSHIVSDLLDENMASSRLAQTSELSSLTQIKSLTDKVDGRALTSDAINLLSKGAELTGDPQNLSAKAKITLDSSSLNMVKAAPLAADSKNNLGAIESALFKNIESIVDGSLSKKSVSPEIALSAVKMPLGAEGSANSASSSFASTQSILAKEASSTQILSVPINVRFGQAQWGQQVSERISWMAANNLQNAEIMLDPPELGPLNVRISSHHDQAVVSFVSANAQVRDALDQQSSRLREMLAEQGINLADVDVSDHSEDAEEDHRASTAKSNKASEDENEPENNDKILTLSLNTGIDDFV